MTTYTHAVYVGRFQPFHAGHKAVLDEALAQSEWVFVVIGSHKAARSPKNPFSAQEREQMILSTLDESERRRVKFIYQRDFPYNHDTWVTSLSAAVETLASRSWVAGPLKIALFGYEKDSSSKYLNDFPKWERIEVKPTRVIHATDIRALYFGSDDPLVEVESWDFVPDEVKEFMGYFRVQNPALYHRLWEEHLFIEEYKEMWRVAPYPVTFVTTDAVVIQSGHVLMTTRGTHPGKGLLALPGGFLERGLTLEDNCIKELVEETGIKVPKAVIRGSIVDTKTFDAPSRSERGRTITQAFFIKLHEPNGELPKVKGGDDAARAEWIPLHRLAPESCFEDHYHIIDKMTGGALSNKGFSS